VIGVMNVSSAHLVLQEHLIDVGEKENITTYALEIFLYSTGIYKKTGHT
jgi:hypothetical protein